MSDAIIWYCTADDSWGGCSERDLIILRQSDLTPDETFEIVNLAAEGNDVWDAISRAYDRINGVSS